MAERNARRFDPWKSVESVRRAFVRGGNFAYRLYDLPSLLARSEMAVFVLGAGATRGASFVDAVKKPCLPPLDADFYAQLQRIQHKKHADTIKRVIKDTVELFGVNFNVTMELVFTTLEHTERMLQTTGENRDFKRGEINNKKVRLKQAIAASLENFSATAGNRQERNAPTTVKWCKK